MHRLSLAALFLLSLSVSSSWAAPALSIGSLDMIAGKSNIYHEAEFHQGQHRIYSEKRGIYKNNGFQREGSLTQDGGGGASSFISRRQQIASDQPDISQEHGPSTPQQDGLEQPVSQPQQVSQETQSQSQPIPQQIEFEKDGDNDGDVDDDDDNDDVNKNQVVAPPPLQLAQPVAAHRLVDPAPINDNNKVLAEENTLPPAPTSSPLLPITKPPINAIPSPTTTPTTTTPRKNTTTPTKNNKISQPPVEPVEDDDGGKSDTEEGLPTVSVTTENKVVKRESASHVYHDGLTVTIEDKNNFCLMLPKSPGDQNIGESEKSARAFCTKEGLTPGAQMMPEGLIKDPEFKSGNSYVQVTGMLNIAAYQLSDQDGGGQYDDHGAGSPPNSHCINYPYYVSLIEPDQNRFCIRCCHSYENCNAGRSEYGCQAVLRDE